MQTWRDVEPVHHLINDLAAVVAAAQTLQGEWGSLDDEQRARLMTMAADRAATAAETVHHYLLTPPPAHIEAGYRQMLRRSFWQPVRGALDAPAAHRRAV